MKNHHIKLPRILVAILFLAATVLQVIPQQTVNAAQITNRRLTLQAGAIDGGSMPEGVVNHFFEFTIPSTGTAIGSIKFEYCTTAANSLASPTCVPPTDLITTAATLGSEAGSGATGFTINNTTNGAPYLTKGTAAVPANGNLKFRLDNITNPSTEATFFVRIYTYNATNATGTPIDSGTVAAAINKQIKLTGIMPESLVFCTGADIQKTASVPDCATATSGDISFDRLFSPVDTASAVSKMAASTNASSGYAITVNGPTLTSGSNTIPGLLTPTASNKGNAQFGLNLRANTVAAAPAFPGTGITASADIDLVSDGISLNGRALPDYAQPDTFKFISGDTVADSNYSPPVTTNPRASNAQIYTVSYIVNVPGSQPAGTYTTTLTYICTPTF